jgi:hypothetical protein
MNTEHIAGENSNHDFNQRNRNTRPDGNQTHDISERHPERGDKPDVLSDHALSTPRLVTVTAV